MIWSYLLVGLLFAVSGFCFGIECGIKNGLKIGLGKRNEIPINE